MMMKNVTSQKKFNDCFECLQNFDYFHMGTTALVGNDENVKLNYDSLTRNINTYLSFI